MGFFEIFSGLLSALYGVIGNYGLAIIALTLISRIVMLPLTIKQTRSMRKMQALQPEVNRIRAKYKSNKQKMNEEMMALYKESGVNPLGGCFPMLLQMPVFIALFSVLRFPLKYMGYQLTDGAWSLNEGLSGVMKSIAESSLAQGLLEVPDKVNGFLGILRLDCSAQNVLPMFEPRGMPGNASPCPHGGLESIPYVVLLIAMGLSTWYQQKQMQASQDASSPQAQQARMMGRIFGIFFLFIGFSFPTGLVLYWTTSNLWGIVQQRIMLGAAPPVEAPVRAKSKSKSPPGGTKGKSSSDGKTKAAPTPGSSNGGKTPAATASRPHPSSKKKKKR
jgi:YidC/Oxa1 family membrane protein insertase